MLETFSRSRLYDNLKNVAPILHKAFSGLAHFSKYVVLPYYYSVVKNLTQG